MPADPHADQPVLVDGEPLASARVAVLLVHGRGASAADIIRLAGHFPREGVCYLAPQAGNDTWYPQRFLAPLAANEPYLTSALAFVGRVLDRIRQAGIPRERTVLGGFSQGACLALETAARNGGHFGGVLGLAGALIGPPAAARPLDRPLDGTPVFLGCGDRDPHIPLTSVQESARVLTALGANVNLHVYPGMDHTIVADELTRSAALIRRVLVART
jgi:predicted esterase